MEPTNLLHVELGPRSYDVVIGAGILADASTWIKQHVTVTQAVVITDENVETPYATSVAESLADDCTVVDLMVVNAGEASKSVSMAEQLWNQMLESNADRKSVVVAVGGGVIGDLAGFVAATYARGLTYIQVPTTLLAQVDSSVGGKVAINLPGAKNMVGAFWQPAVVLVDPRVLSSLPKREYRAGLGEVVKYGVILDADFFTYLEQHVDPILARDEEVLRNTVTRCCQLKADVVQEDEREESGRRAILNYGHTFAHALESATKYEQFLHGEAVSIGMLCASRLAELLGLVDHEFTSRQQELLTAFGLPVSLPAVDRTAFLEAMQQDKKVEHGKLRLVLPTQMGHVGLVEDVATEQILAALHE